MSMDYYLIFIINNKHEVLISNRILMGMVFILYNLNLFAAID